MITSKPGELFELSATVNGKCYTEKVPPRLLLVDFLRMQLGLTGTHIGCDTTSCGACTVLLDGRAIKSCTIFAVQADGKEIETVEGLAEGDELSALQRAFQTCHGLQCGYCTPGMLMAGTYLLRQNPDPTEEEIRRAISGNICRCTGYQNIVKAIATAAKEMREGAGRESAQ